MKKSNVVVKLLIAILYIFPMQFFLSLRASTDVVIPNFQLLASSENRLELFQFNQDVEEYDLKKQDIAYLIDFLLKESENLLSKAYIVRNIEKLEKYIESYQTFDSKILSYRKMYDVLVKKLGKYIDEAVASLYKYNPESNTLYNEQENALSDEQKNALLKQKIALSKAYNNACKVEKEDLKNRLNLRVTLVEARNNDIQKIKKNYVIINGYIKYIQGLDKDDEGLDKDNVFLQHNLLDKSIPNLFNDLSNNPLSEKGKKYLKAARNVYKEMEKSKVFDLIARAKTPLFDGMHYPVQHWKLLHVFLGSLPLNDKELIGGVHFKPGNYTSIYDSFVCNDSKKAVVFYLRDSVFIKGNNNYYAFKVTSLFPDKYTIKESVEIVLRALERIFKMHKKEEEPNFLRFIGIDIQTGLTIEFLYDKDTQTIISFYPIYKNEDVRFGNISKNDYEKFKERYKQLKTEEKNNCEVLLNLLLNKEVKKNDQNDDDQQQVPKTPDIKNRNNDSLEDSRDFSFSNSSFSPMKNLTPKALEQERSVNNSVDFMSGFYRGNSDSMNQNSPMQANQNHVLSQQTLQETVNRNLFDLPAKEDVKN